MIHFPIQYGNWTTWYVSPFSMGIEQHDTFPHSVWELNNMIRFPIQYGNWTTWYISPFSMGIEQHDTFPHSVWELNNMIRFPIQYGNWTTWYVSPFSMGIEQHDTFPHSVWELNNMIRFPIQYGNWTTWYVSPFSMGIEQHDTFSHSVWELNNMIHFPIQYGNWTTWYVSPFSMGIEQHDTFPHSVWELNNMIRFPIQYGNLVSYRAGYGIVVKIPGFKSLCDHHPYHCVLWVIGVNLLCMKYCKMENTTKWFWILLNSVYYRKYFYLHHTEIESFGHVCLKPNMKILSCKRRFWFCNVTTKINWCLIELMELMWYGNMLVKQYWNIHISMCPIFSKTYVRHKKHYHKILKLVILLKMVKFLGICFLIFISIVFAPRMCHHRGVIFSGHPPCGR